MSEYTKEQEAAISGYRAVLTTFGAIKPSALDHKTLLDAQMRMMAQRQAQQMYVSNAQYDKLLGLEEQLKLKKK